MKCSRRISALIVGAVLAASMVGSGVVRAQDSNAEPFGLEILGLGPPEGRPIDGELLAARTLEVGRLIRCPVCQGLSIADSPAQSAIAMKEEVRRLLAAGYSQAQVLDHFESAYGEFVRLEPKKTGLNWLVWLLPAASFVFGLGLVGRRLWNRRTRPGEAVEDSEDLQVYLERVRSEVSE